MGGPYDETKSDVRYRDRMTVGSGGLAWSDDADQAALLKALRAPS